MLCFVLQNFKNYYPFLIKTPRYYMMVKALNTDLLSIFIKTHIYWNFLQKNLSLLPSFFKTLFNTQFTKTFWIFFKKIISKKMGLCSNNFFKSCLFHTFNGIEVKNVKLKQFKLKYGSDISFFSKPIQTLNFSFQKKIYNTFIFFIKNILIENYYTHLNFYKLMYGFIFFKSNFIIYPFLNNYYFKIRNN